MNPAADADVSGPDHAPLRVLFDAHVQRPFPAGGPPATAGLKADLVAYDSRIAGHVSRLLAGGWVDAAGLAPDPALEAALRAAAGDQPFARELLAYLRQVDALAQAALGDMR